MNIIQDWGGNINIREEQEQDTNLNEARKAIEEGKPPPGFPGQMHKLCVQDGILYQKFKPSHSSSVILQMILPTALQTLVLQQLHDKSGHCSVAKTIGKVMFYWRGYERDIENYVKCCRPRQQRKSPCPAVQAPIGTIHADLPFQRIAWDITGPFPETERGNRYIVVITDLFSRWVEAFPVKKTDSITLQIF